MVQYLHFRILEFPLTRGRKLGKNDQDLGFRGWNNVEKPQLKKKHQLDLFTLHGVRMISLEFLTTSFYTSTRFVQLGLNM